MANNETLIPIPGRLHSVATEGHVAGSNEIYDDTLAKDQATINSEVNTAFGTGGTVDSRIAAAKAEVIGGASTDYNTLGKVEGKVENIADNVAYIDGSESSPAVVPSFDPESQTVHITAQTLSEQQKAQVRANIGLDDVDAKINEKVASEASQRTAADEDAMENGAMLPSLLSDTVHLNSYGQNAFNIGIQQKLEELGII